MTMSTLRAVLGALLVGTPSIPVIPTTRSIMYYVCGHTRDCGFAPTWWHAIPMHADNPCAACADETNPDGSPKWARFDFRWDADVEAETPTTDRP